MSILEARDLGFAYGPEKWALRGVTFSLTAPRRLCLLGANGVGKSTLMLLLNGTLRPCEGELHILGASIDYSRTGLQRLRQRVGIVLQDPDDQLFGATVEQDVAFGLLNNGFGPREARAKVLDTLADLGILHLSDRPIHNLSLGEKKRVALAGVLVLDPSVLLLDEPSAGLDDAAVAAMLRLLNSLHASGTTIVVSTHDTDLAYEWAEDAWVLVDGKVAAMGPIVELMRQRELLRTAHLRLPWLAELGLAIRESANEPNRLLPRTRDELIALVAKRRADW